MAEEEKKLKVLVCDDDGVTRDLLSVNLSKLSCDVDCIDNGDKLLDKLRLEDYDVLFLDIMLPGKDGIALLKTIKENKPKTAVIMITAYAVEESKAKEIGAADYLYKPFDWDKMCWIIDRVGKQKHGDSKKKDINTCRE